MAKTTLKTLPLHQLLKKLRKENDLTLTLAAAKAKIDPAILSKIENGKRKINKPLLLRLCIIYNANSSELVALFLYEKILTLLKREEDALSVLKLLSQNKSLKAKKH